MEANIPKPVLDQWSEFNNKKNYEEPRMEKKYSKLDFLVFVNKHLSENVSVDHLIYLIKTRL